MKKSKIRFKFTTIQNITNFCKTRYKRQRLENISNLVKSITRDVGLRRILCAANVRCKVLVCADAYAIIFFDSLRKRVRRLHFGCV